MITQNFNLNLIPDSAPVVVHVDQYDVGEGRFVIKLMNGDTPYTPVGATAVIQGMKPDGHGFIYAATISGNTVTADLVEQMSIVAGNVRCQLVITDADDRTGTFVFIIAVQKSALPADSDMSTSDYQLVENLIITAESINTNPPKIGVNGNWWIWDVSTMQYVDSGVDASITVNIADITMLSPDATPYVTNTGTNTDPVFHLFIPRGQTGATGPAAGFGTPTASVDANVGTPSVSISASGPDTAKVFDFQFHNMKGATGNTGATGAAAGFGTPTASVDANTGTPSVSVSASGPDTAKIFDFQFHNLKGETGTDANAVHWADNLLLGAANNLLQIPPVIRIRQSSDNLSVAISEQGIRISGTKASGHWADVVFDGVHIELKGGVSYKLIANGVQSNVKGIRLKSNGSFIYNMSDGATEEIYTPANDIVIDSWETTFAIAEADTLDMTYQPMLLLASNTNNTFTLPVKTNKQLTDLFKYSDWATSHTFHLDINSFALLVTYGGGGGSLSSVIPIHRGYYSVEYNQNLLPSGLSITVNGGDFTISSSATFTVGIIII